MRCNAMRRSSLRKYEHFGMIDDSKGRTRKEGGERGMRGSMISLCMCVWVRECVCECARSSAVAIDDLSCAAAATRRIYACLCALVCTCVYVCVCVSVVDAEVEDF